MLACLRSCDFVTFALDMQLFSKFGEVLVFHLMYVRSQNITVLSWYLSISKQPDGFR